MGGTYPQGHELGIDSGIEGAARTHPSASPHDWSVDEISLPESLTVFCGEVKNVLKMNLASEIK